MAISVIQSKSLVQGNTANPTITLDYDKTLGSTVVLFVSMPVSRIVNSITDEGCVYEAIYDGSRYAVWICRNNTSVDPTVTIHLSGTNNGGILMALELSGVDRAHAIEMASGDSGGPSVSIDVDAEYLTRSKSTKVIAGVMNEILGTTQSTVSPGWSVLNSGLSPAGVTTHRNYVYGKDFTDPVLVEDLDVTLSDPRLWEYVIFGLHAAVVEDESNEDLLDSISGDHALETTQTMLRWSFRDSTPQLRNLYVQRSSYRYPEDVSEGTTVLSEAADNADLRTSVSDTTVEELRTYYYSLFVKFYGPYSLDRSAEYDISRLGTPNSVNNKFEYKSVVIDTGDNVTVTFSGNLGYLRVQPGSITITTVDGVTRTVTDDGTGNWIGYAAGGSINYETGSYSVTFTGAPDNLEDIVAEFLVESDSHWILVRSSLADGSSLIWDYDTKTAMCNEYITMSFLKEGEVAKSIAGYMEDALTRTFRILTSTRYISATILQTATDISDSDIVIEWSLNSLLSADFQVTGGTTILGYSGPPGDILILDNGNLLATIHDITTGAILFTFDITGLAEYGEFQGIAEYTDTVSGTRYVIVGATKVLLGFDYLAGSPDFSDIKIFQGVRREFDSDFCCLLTSIVVVDRGLRVLEEYPIIEVTNAAPLQIEEPAYILNNVAALWRMEDPSGSAVNSISGGPTLVPNGTVTYEADGKFSKCFSLDTQTSYLLGDVSSLNDPASGAVMFWWKPPYQGFIPPTADSQIFFLYTDGSNYIQLQLLTTGELEITHRGLGVNRFITIASPANADDGLFHHYCVAWDSASFYLYFDGELLDSGTIANVPSALNSLYIGHPTTGVYGYYDEIAFWGEWLPQGVFQRTGLTTKGNRAYAFSGRDGTEDRTYFRDKLKQYFAQDVLEKDYNKVKSSANKELSDGEVIFRQDESDLLLGDLGRTSRLVGLMLDRIVDKREYFRNHLTPSEVEDAYIARLAEHIGATDVDPDWNVEVKRRFLEVYWFCKNWRGNYRAFVEMARFLGFRLWYSDGLPHTVSRRYWDSVPDPTRTDTPLDTGILDSGDGSHYLVKLLLTLFKENYSGSTGQTIVPVTSQRFEDPNVPDFTEIAEIGSLLHIYDVGDSGDNGYYYVTTVNSGYLLLDRDWTAASLTGLTYHLHWQVPEVDPYKDQVLSRLATIKARWQNLGYQSLP